MFDVNVEYGETKFTKADLMYWDETRNKDVAHSLIKEGFKKPSSISLQIHPIVLRDVILRAGEDVATWPDRDLEAYWEAVRGLPTYYSPLLLSGNNRTYKKFLALPSIGNGIALYLLEDRFNEPAKFGLNMFCRPLGASPSFLMRNLKQNKIAIIEARATESVSTSRGLTESVVSSLDILNRWSNHRSLDQLMPISVSTSINEPGMFNTQILKLKYRGH